MYQLDANNVTMILFS